MTDTWSPERIERLIELTGEKLSAEAIANALGITRNAVIGKLHRLGIALQSGSKGGAPAHRTSPRPRKPVQRRRLTAAAVAALKAPLADPEPPVPAQAHVKPVTIADLRNGPIRQCRYIAGKSSANALYCGAPVKPGSSYCPHHHQRCWQSVASRIASHKHIEAAE